MSFIGTVENIIKAYYSNGDKHYLINELMKSDNIQDIVNSSSYDIIYKKSHIEALLKHTGMIVADILIDNTHNEKSKEFVINYCIAMFFKHNKYEAAMMTTFKYTYNIARVFNYIQDSNTDINILKAIFSKYSEDLNTYDGRKWLMILIGKYNDIELLSHVEDYYGINDTDIMNILFGTIDKKNILYCLNTIKYIFENYDFCHDIIPMFHLIKELYYLENSDALIYVLTKLVEKNGINYIDDFLNNQEIDNYLYSNLIDYFITAFNDYLIPNASNNIINIQ
jgi:hypothetical protein